MGRISRRVETMNYEAGYNQALKGENRQLLRNIECQSSYDNGYDAALREELTARVRHEARGAEVVDLTHLDTGHPDHPYQNGAPQDETRKGIGDINSEERGTSARYNDGKTQLEYIPMRLLVGRYAKPDTIHKDIGLLMAQFEEGEDSAIFNLFDIIDLKHTCDVFAFGAKKYKAHNWMKGFPWSSVIASFKRHWIAIAIGEEIDPESGLPHSGHMGCNVTFLAQFTRTWRSGDDRPNPDYFNKE